MSDKQLKTPPPILRVLDVKEQVRGLHESRKDNLQPPYLSTFAIFHENTAKNGLFFGQKLSFLASDKQLKDPFPLL